MASRLWQKRDCDSDNDSDSDSDSDIYSEDERNRLKLGYVSVKVIRNPSRYLEETNGGDSKTTTSDKDESDDEKRVVVSAKKKRFQEMSDTVEQIQNAMKINDWVTLQERFDKINKQLEKVMRAVEAGKTPNVYVKALVLLEDYLNETLLNKEGMKKMSSSNAKALNRLKQSIKKNNKQYEDLINKYRENPVAEDEEEEPVQKVEEPDEPEKADVLERSDHEEEWHVKVWKKYENLMKNEKEITWDTVNKKLKETLAMRGKKGTGRMELVEKLTYLSRIARTSAQKLEILMNVVSAQFDVNPSLTGHMPITVWKKCVHNMFVILAILSLHSSIILVDDTVEPEENETQKNPYHERTIRVRGDLLAFFERLEAEFYKILVSTDPCTSEYVERLREEPLFLALAYNLQQYFLRSGNLKTATKLALKSVEFVYYKPQEVYYAMKKFYEQSEEPKDEPAGEISEGADEGKGTTLYVITPEVVLRKPSFPECSKVFMDTLITFIYRFGDERSKARAMLCDIYHLALMGDFSIARDLMLKSNLQDTIHHMDISTQILFNRAMAQLGLSAFRNGLIVDGHSCLSELYSTGRVRELLGQGLSQSWYHNKTPKQELIEMTQQMPYHMLINLDVLEAVYLTCAMLLEVPYAAATSFTDQRRIKSKTLRKALEASEKQTWIGPPESIRDHVVAATKALYESDFQKAFDCITSLTVWKFLRNKETVFEMLKYNMKEVALKTYLHTSCASYCCSASLDRLSRMFELSESEIFSIASKMMVNRELRAVWDQPTRCIVFNEVEYTRLQAVAFRLADNLSIITRNNERAMEVKLGGGNLDGLPLMRNDYTEVASTGSGGRSVLNNAYSQWNSSGGLWTYGETTSTIEQFNTSGALSYGVASIPELQTDSSAQMVNLNQRVC